MPDGGGQGAPHPFDRVPGEILRQQLRGAAIRGQRTLLGQKSPYPCRHERTGRFVKPCQLVLRPEFPYHALTNNPLFTLIDYRPNDLSVDIGIR